MRIRIVLILLLGAPNLFAAHDKEKEAAAREEKTKVTSVTGYMAGRWVDGTLFEYQTTEKEWASPAAVKVATDKDPGEFLNAAGEKVKYEVGDVLFRIEGRGWFKAKKDSPKVEDEMVPNPFKVQLSKLEREMVRETNLWRKERKLPPLAVDPILMKTARARSHDFNHNANGMSSWDEAHRNGFSGTVTDNLSSRDETAKGSVQNLASDGPSEGHYKQLMGQYRINGAWTDFHPNRIGVSTSGPGGTWVHIYGRDDSKKK